MAIHERTDGLQIPHSKVIFRRLMYEPVMYPAMGGAGWAPPPSWVGASRRVLFMGEGPSLKSSLLI